MNEEIKLYHGDCLDIMKKLLSDNVKVDCIITDPPYVLDLHGGGQNDLGKRKLTKDKHIEFISGGFSTECFELMLKLQNIPNLLIFCSNKQVSTIMSFFEQKKLTTTLLVWEKTNPSPLCNGKHLSDIEFIVYVRGKGATFNNDTPYEYKKKVYTSPVVSNKNRLHPTQKSVVHIQQYIKLHTKENDVVLDPFMGSGTTGVACINTNRKFIGIELDDNYFDIAKKRIEDTSRNRQLNMF